MADDDVVAPEPAPPDRPLLFYRRGKRSPRAIAWFGFRSFWGHLWHLAASVIATEDIDSRGWMHPDEQDVLTRRVAKRLAAADPGAPTLTDALGQDLFVDFVADTGDDYDVSRAVAKLVVARFEVDDPERPGERLTLPRGDVLVFGGDTAYPVATDFEIHNRVVVPFNLALRGVRSAEGASRPRVLLGIPGNHDWYAGLDGFGRLFRARRTKLDRAARAGVSSLQAASKPKGEVELEVDPLAQVKHFVQWVEAFRVGRYVVKRPALALEGYEPVQSASYWSLRLAPSLDLWGVDRQLRNVDFRQRGYFGELRDADRGVMLCLADPVHAFLAPNPSGVGVLDALDLSLERDGLLVLTGDTHHYCRQRFGPGMHVIAGGGGAFLHPAAIARRGLPQPEAEFPGPKVSLALALQVPWQIVHGRSGFLVHAVVAATLLPTFGVMWMTGSSAPKTSLVTTIVAAVFCMLLGGWRQRPLPVAALSAATGVAVGLVAPVVHAAVGYAASRLALHLAPSVTAFAAYALSVYTGTLAVGTYLMMLTILGLEQHQAFSALAHPGYKHFVRLRVKRDGSRVHGWVFGRVDPLSKTDKVVLVDSFVWDNPKAKALEPSASPAPSGASPA